MIVVSRGVRMHGAEGRREVPASMVRVQVIGDRDVATAPVRRALARVPGVEILDHPGSPRATDVDTVVIDRSLGPETTPEGVLALAAVYPGASLLVLALHRGSEYRWVHVRPHGTAFRVYDAGTGPLSAILAGSLGAPDDAAPGRVPRDAHQATLPAIPCSTA
jgi:hypothetical protein